MQFTLASLALCASSALALTVNTPPGPLTAGKPFTIGLIRDGGETGSVTVNLRKGDASNLATIETIGSTTTDSLSFTPSTSLVDGSDYAFEAVYRDQTGKYSAFFTITGGSTSSSASSSSSMMTTKSTLAATTPITTLTSYDSASSSTMTTVSTGAPVVVVPSNTTLTTVAPVTNTAGSTIGVGPTVIPGNGTLSNTLTSYTTTAAGATMSAAGMETATSTVAGAASASGSGVYGASGNPTSSPVQQVGSGAAVFGVSTLVVMAAAAAALF